MLGTELLNIKQAAQYLNVSEVSIRRWTDSGKLPCLRVGGRRERRFEHQDLVDFMDRRQGSNTESKKIGIPGKNSADKILLEGMSINYGSHLCSLYETDKGCIKLSVPFLADGLRSGNKCFLLASRQNQDNIIRHLSDAYPDTGLAVESSRLILSEGLPNSHDLHDYLEQQFLEAARSGSQYLRLVSDMAWALDAGMDVDDLMSFEKQYNHSLAKSFAVVTLCQYDARRFSGTEILQALKNHEDTFKYPMSRLVGF